MMNVRTLLVVSLAIVCGVSAAVGVSRMRVNNVTQVASVEMASLLVAAVEIPRGTEVTSSMLTTSEWPKDMLPAGAVTAAEEAVGRTVVIPLLKGEPLLEQKIAKAGFGRGVAPLVSHGMRAFTVVTPTLSAGVGGLVLPGNKVDILWTASTTNAGGTSRDSYDERTGGGATLTLLQNIEILAADRQIGENGETDAKALDASRELRSVTLQVTEEDAKKLSLAQQKGTINLSLRNSGDAGRITSPIVTLDDIRYAQGRPPEAVTVEDIMLAKTAPPPAPQSVRVRIRTLHGPQPGQVVLELFGKAAVPEPPPSPEPGDRVAESSLPISVD
jgi:pilus assembly protein CpaB